MLPTVAESALGSQCATRAVGVGYRGYFSGADDMVHALLAARRDGTFGTRLRTYTQPTVLVVDDVGLLPIDAEGAGVFFHVVNARYEPGHPTLGDHQPGPAGVGPGVRRRRGGRRDPRPAHAPGGVVQHPGPVVAHARARRPRRGVPVLVTAAVVLVALLAVVTQSVAATIEHVSAKDKTSTSERPAPRDPRARAPPARGSTPSRWTRPKAIPRPCPTDRPTDREFHPAPFPQVQANGRVHDRNA